MGVLRLGVFRLGTLRPRIQIPLPNLLQRLIQNPPNSLSDLLRRRLPPRLRILFVALSEGLYLRLALAPVVRFGEAQ